MSHILKIMTHDDSGSGNDSDGGSDSGCDTGNFSGVVTNGTNTGTTSIPSIPSIKNSNQMLPWVEKYRPSTLSNVIEHENIILALNSYKEKKFMPHLLFYGPPGTGKTSIIMAYARELYGNKIDRMVLELNASDERGIDVVRKRIKSFVMSQSLCFDNTNEKPMFKLVILDEIDAMTQDAQAILKKLVETYTLNARFCLICNYIQKINLALQSRCVTFRFAPLKKKNIIPKINHVISQENINITALAKNIIIDRSGGDMRKIFNQLQSVTMAHVGDKITPVEINNFFGYPSSETIDTVIYNLINNSFNLAFNNITQIKKYDDLSITDIVTEIYQLLETSIISDKCSNLLLTKLSLKQQVAIVDKLKLIELNQHISVNENIQVATLIAIFKNVL